MLQADKQWDPIPLTKIRDSSHGPYLLEYLEWLIVHKSEELRLTHPSDIGTVGRLQGYLSAVHELNEVLLADEIPEDET